jgi:hypothetical protein
MGAVFFNKLFVVIDALDWYHPESIWFFEAFQEGGKIRANIPVMCKGQGYLVTDQGDTFLLKDFHGLLPGDFIAIPSDFLVPQQW